MCFLARDLPWGLSPGRCESCLNRNPHQPEITGVHNENRIRSLPAPGHLYPTITLARRVRSRGHQVVMIAPPDVEAFVRGADLPFAAFGEKLYTPGRIAGSVNN